MAINAGEMITGREVCAPRSVPLAERFAECFTQEYPRLVGFCTGLVGATEGPDIAEEALVRTFSHWTTVRDPHTHVYLVATNLACSCWRRQQRRQDMRSLMRRRTAEIAGPDTGLRDLIARLPTTQRVPVLLHYHADLPLETVAMLLGRPAGTVRHQLHEASTTMASQQRREELT